jgi:hypothetical protein
MASGKQKEGLALLNEAADLKPVFKDEMPLFQGGKIEF